MHGDVRDQDRLRDPARHPVLGEPQALGGRGAAGVADADVLAVLEPELLGDLAEGDLRAEPRLRLRRHGDHPFDVVLARARRRARPPCRCRR